MALWLRPPRGGGGKSITELEYRKARSAGKPCFLFVLDENALWLPADCDWKTKENASGSRIEALRRELMDNGGTPFDSAATLVAKLSASIQNWEKKPPAVPSVSAPQQRELRNSLLLCHTPLDAGLARNYAETLQVWLDRPILLSETALFAADEAGFEQLESDACRSAAGAILVSQAALGQLPRDPGRLDAVLALLRGRLHDVSVLTCGFPAGALPGTWGLSDAFELPVPVPPLSGPLVQPLLQFKGWLDRVMPPRDSRNIGLPVSVLCMTSAEYTALAQNPGLVGERLGGKAQEQFETIRTSLRAAGIPWGDGYAADRSGWRPFGLESSPIATMVEKIADEVNRRQLTKLRQRRIKVQWYPFDAIKDQASAGDSRLRSIYRNVGRAGCVLIVDEMSLFQPDLNEAFRDSPFFNNERVSLVTLSPFDPHARALDVLLEQNPRRKLAGAFDRFTSDCDPQCELAVSDPLRLRRWLHWSLPEAVSSLREPRPDQTAMSAFFAAELGADQKQDRSDYPWAGAAR